MLTTYTRAGALLIGGLAVQLLIYWFGAQLGLLWLVVVPAGLIATGLVLGIMSAAHGRIVEVGGGFVGVVSGTFVGTILFPDNVPPDQLLLALVIVGTPYLVGAISKYLLVREAAEERLHSAFRAPAGSTCGQCGKPLSPYWRGKCHHCGAWYEAHPPVKAGA